MLKNREELDEIFDGIAMTCTNVEDNTWEAVADQDSVSKMSWKVATQASSIASTSADPASSIASTSSAAPGGSYKERLFDVLPEGVFPILSKIRDKKRNLGYTSYVETEIWEDEKAGLVTVTGNVHRIMRESITRARVYATKFMKLNKFGDISKTKLIVDVLPSFMSKDGPSAAAGILTSMLSRVLETAPLNNCAILAEIDFYGNLGAVSGIGAKLKAAKRCGIHTILMPRTMTKAWNRLDKELTKNFTLKIMNKYQEAFEFIFPGLANKMRRK